MSKGSMVVCIYRELSAQCPAIQPATFLFTLTIFIALFLARPQQAVVEKAQKTCCTLSAQLQKADTVRDKVGNILEDLAAKE